MGKAIHIFCLEQDRQISDLIADVYNSIPCQIDRQTDFDADTLHALEGKEFNLVVVDNHYLSYPIASLETLVRDNAGMQWVVVDEDQNLRGYHHYQNLKLISKNEISSKLPPILAEIYQEIHDSSLNNSVLSGIHSAIIDTLDIFIAIVRKSGEFIYLNKAGSERLGLADEAGMEIRFQDIVSDGLTVWEYLIRHCLHDRQPLQHYKILLRDRFNQTSSIDLNIRRIQADDEYLLLQETPRPTLQGPDTGHAASNILNQFAQSIANELLNPINVISGRLQLLKGTLSNHRDRDAFKSIADMQKQVDRMNGTISKLVTFATLKEDVVPQKIQAGEILKNISFEPSITRWLEKDPHRLQVEVKGEIPVLMGLPSHFDLLLKLLIEAGLEFVGSEGGIRAEVCRVESDEHRMQVKFSFLLTYSNPIFGEEHTLCKFMQNKQTIEGTIIDHILHTYKGLARCGTKNTEKEFVEILFPVYDINP